MMVLVVLMLFLFFVCLSNANSISTFKTEPHNCLKRFLKNHLQYNGNIVVGNLSRLDGDLPKFKTYYKTDFENLLKLLKNIKEKPNIFILIPNSLKELTVMLQNIKGNPHFSILNEIIVIVKHKKNLQVVAETMWNFAISKDILILKSENQITFYTTAFKNHSCGKLVKPRKILGCNITVPNKKEFARVIKKNLKNCPLYTIWAEEPPFIVETSNSSFAGLFPEILKAISSHIHREIILMPRDDMYLEDISAGYYFGSIAEDLNGGYASIFVGPVDTVVTVILSLSPILTKNSLYLLVPRKKQELFFQRMITSHFYRYYIATLIITVVIITFLAKFTLEKKTFGSVVKNTLMFLRFTVGFAFQPKRPKSLALWIIVGSFAITSDIITLFIQGNFVSSITSSDMYGPPIEDTETLVKANIPIKLLGGSKRLFQSHPYDPYQKIIYQKSEKLEGVSTLTDTGDLALKMRSFATLVDDAFFSMRPVSWKEFSKIEVYNFKLHFAVAKNHPTYETLYGTTVQLIENGIVDRIIKLDKYRYFLKSFLDQGKKPAALSIAKVKINHYGLCVGLTLATLVFISEILVNYLTGLCEKNTKLTEKSKNYYTFKKANVIKTYRTLH